MTIRQRVAERLRQLAKQQTSTADETDIRLAAVMIDRDDAKDKRRIINEFIDRVDALAQQKMLITGVREGAHYAALIQLQREMNDE